MDGHFYRIAGLTVASEFSLPGAIATSPGGVAADVLVSLGPVSATLRDGPPLGPNWDMAGDRVLIEVPGVARFLVHAGHRIIVALDPGATTQDASAHLLGTMIGIALHQRGRMVLHGAAVARNGGAIIICGVSGAGKSTLAAALCARGAQIVSDELCAIGQDDGTGAHVHPDGRDLRLWRDAIDQLGLAAQQRAPVVAGIQKYFVAAASAPPAASPLQRIYVLHDSRPVRQIRIAPRSTADAMTILDQQAYRPVLREKISARPQWLGQHARLLSAVGMFRIDRPRAFDTLDRTADALLAHWDGGVQ